MCVPEMARGKWKPRCAEQISVREHILFKSSGMAQKKRGTQWKNIIPHSIKFKLSWHRLAWALDGMENEDVFKDERIFAAFFVALLCFALLVHYRLACYLHTLGHKLGVFPPNFIYKRRRKEKFGHLA